MKMLPMSVQQVKSNLPLSFQGIRLLFDVIYRIWVNPNFR